jgi:ABC-2 type transport system permease protein
MFNKTIFKQTLKANFKIWLIITVVLSVLITVLIGVFDPKTISSMTSMVEGTPLAKMLGNTTFLGMLSQTFYGLQGVILPLIFIIITANNLIVSQVDRGSIAYLLSTPTKRSTVVSTQITYFIASLCTMFFIVTIVGLFAIQAFHGGVWGNSYTEDVKATSKVLNMKNADIANDLTLILNNKEALKVGAEARGLDEEAYTAYLNLKISDNAYKAAADNMAVSVDEVSKNPSVIKSNDEALAAAAKVMGMDKATYSAYLDKVVAEKAALAKQSKEMQDKILKGFTAASEVLGIDESEVVSDMGKIKSSNEALSAAVNASGIPQEMFTKIINNQIATNAVAADKGIDLNVHDYLMLNLGLFLLMFAISSISFMFSCIFNLTKNYMALGAGIPLAFFLFQMMSQVSSNLKGIKYLTLNSLFDTHAILNGGSYLLQFIALAVIGIVLYIIGMRVFKEKDLPL